ncbi:MarR family winged helix-turn-helix transcriptional regulator [Frateuria aurantia]
MPRHELKTPDERLRGVATDLRTFVGQLKRRLRQEADVGDLTHSQTAVLLRLENEGAATVSKLARAEGVRSQSMGVTVAALEQSGYVTGVPDATDKRQTLISLTEKCRRWMAEGRAAREDYLVRALHDRLDAQELSELERLIPLLKRLVNA